MDLGLPMAKGSTPNLLVGGADVVIDLNELKPLEIFIMEKDSKKFFIFNTGNTNVITASINCSFNFPHNF